MSRNGWGIERLGVKQKKILQLMLDNEGRWPWDEDNNLLYTERKTMQSLVEKKLVEPLALPLAHTWCFRVVPERMEELKERYAMKVHVR